MTEILCFNAKEAPEELWRAYYEYRAILNKEISPDDPLPASSEHKKILELLASDLQQEHVPYLLLSNGESGRVIGYGKLMCEKLTSPSYEKNKKTGVIDLSIHPRFRRKGYGTKLFHFLLEELKARSPGAAQAEVKTLQPSGKAFLEKHGGRVDQVRSRSRLYLNSVDWWRVAGGLSDLENSSPGTGLELAPVVPERDIEEFSRVYTEVINQQPFGEAGPDFIYTPGRIRKEDASFKEAGVERWFVYAREPDGRISGFSEILHILSPGHRIDQGLTGVREEYRGRGLGKILKCRMLLHIKERYPAARFISTASATDNPWMLAINEWLGFTPYSQRTSYLFPLRPCERPPLV